MYDPVFMTVALAERQTVSTEQYNTSSCEKSSEEKDHRDWEADYGLIYFLRTSEPCSLRKPCKTWKNSFIFWTVLGKQEGIKENLASNKLTPG